MGAYPGCFAGIIAIEDTLPVVDEDIDISPMVSTLSEPSLLSTDIGSLYSETSTTFPVTQREMNAVRW